MVRNIGDTIAFCPPLIISEAQVHEMVEKFATGLNATLDWVSKNTQ